MGEIGEAATLDASPESGAQSQPAAQVPQPQAEAAPKAPNLLGNQEQSDPADNPLTEWSDSILDLPKDAGIDPDMVASFGKAAIGMGLNAKQAKALASWQMQAVNDCMAARMEAQKAKLQELWGSNTRPNCLKLQEQIRLLDRQKGFEGIAQALDQSGATNNAVVLNALFKLLGRYSEASGMKSYGSAPSPETETELEGIRRAFAEARGEI